MAIKFSKFIDITSGVGGAAAAARRDLGLRVFTTSDVLTYGAVLVCTGADEVMSLFGSESDEYRVAAAYFGYISNSITKARQISFVKWAETPIAQTVFSGTAAPADIAEFAGPVGLRFSLAKEGADDPETADVMVDFGNGADSYEAVASAFTAAMVVASADYGWLKGSSLDYEKGRFRLTFTAADKTASVGPQVTVLDYAGEEAVENSCRLFGMVAIDGKTYALNRFDAEGVWTQDQTGWKMAKPWDGRAQYDVGDFVIRNGVVYCCKVGISAPGEDDEANRWEPSLWSRRPKTLEKWNSAVSYKVGDWVTASNGAEDIVFCCKVAGSSSPLASESWSKVDENAVYWSGYSSYAEGARVVNVGSDGGEKIYTALQSVPAPGDGVFGIVGTDRDQILPETAVECVNRVESAENNFGSFMFLATLDVPALRKLAEWTHGKNYEYQFWAPATWDGTDAYWQVAAALNGYTCVNVTYCNRREEFPEFMPAALFASTDYTRVNSTKTFMYKQFAGVDPSVGLKNDPLVNGNALYSTLDSLRINYYGQTMKSGKSLCFYQDGNNMDGTETSVACNEIWMKDAIKTEIINLLIAMEKVPANAKGLAMLTMQVQGVISEAVANGTISPGKELTNTQKQYIDTVTGESGAHQKVFTDGYWFGITLKTDDSTGSTKYVADYVLVYSKGDAIRKVTGSDIMI